MPHEGTARRPLAQLKRAARRADAIGQPGESAARPGYGPAGAVVADLGDGLDPVDANDDRGLVCRGCW